MPVSCHQPVSGSRSPEALPQKVIFLLNKLPRQMGVVSQILFALWLVLMILIPHFLRLGDRSTLLSALSAAILVQVALVLSLLNSKLKGPETLRIGLLVVVLAWLAEFIGIHTGLPFGHYAYTDALMPQVGNVPIQIPAAWLMMLPPAWAVGTTITSGMNQATFSRKWVGKAASSLAAGLAFSTWDLFLDPQMVAWKVWRWETPGSYFGIPVINFVGWTLIAGTLSFIVLSFTETDSLPLDSLLLVYTATWLLSSIGLGLFFGLPGAAAAGFFGMGLFVALAWRQRLARPE